MTVMAYFLLLGIWFGSLPCTRLRRLPLWSPAKI
jgi:hypothetical protein